MDTEWIHGEGSFNFIFKCFYIRINNSGEGNGLHLNECYASVRADLHRYEHSQFFDKLWSALSPLILSHQVAKAQ
jgi:hypothetical protein